jgi:N-acetylmuramoyl-L-alanine amidase
LVATVRSTNHKLDGTFQLRNMNKSIALIALLAFMSMTFAANTNGTPIALKKSITIIIDAGHGGDDPGNMTTNKAFKEEKDLNLAISNQVGAYLKAAFPKRVNIIYTRASDVFVPLGSRVSVAHSQKADYFISIHCNASAKQNVAGVETHIHNADSKVALELAKQIQDELIKIPGRTNRGVKVKHDRGYNLMVLKSSSMPAVLIECGFMTNNLEEAFLNSAKGQSSLAQAIFNAFSNYIKIKHGIKPKETETKPVYKIQIMASRKQISLVNPINEGEMAEEIKVAGNFPFKYYIGAYDTKKEAKNELKKLKDSPFKDAFIVKF